MNWSSKKRFTLVVHPVFGEIRGRSVYGLLAVGAERDEQLWGGHSNCMTTMHLQFF